MAHYSATVTSPRTPDEVFSYLADFRSVAEWDPSITESTHVNDGEPIQVGAQFHVVTSTSGPDVVLDYETIELERPAKIVLRGENDSVTSLDTITIAPAAGGGCEVTYDAELELKGIRKVADPLLALGFSRLGDKSRDGLERKLNEG